MTHFIQLSEVFVLHDTLYLLEESAKTLLSPLMLNLLRLKSTLFKTLLKLQIRRLLLQTISNCDYIFFVFHIKISFRFQVNRHVKILMVKESDRARIFIFMKWFSWSFNYCGNLFFFVIFLLKIAQGLSFLSF